MTQTKWVLLAWFLMACAVLAAIAIVLVVNYRARPVERHTMAGGGGGGGTGPGVVVVKYPPCAEDQGSGCGGGGVGVPGRHRDAITFTVPPGTTQLIIERYGVGGGGKPLCVTVKGEKGANGGGNGGDATICGSGSARGGAGGGSFNGGEK